MVKASATFSIEEELSSLPDQVADALEKWRRSTLEKEGLGARLYLRYKAERCEEKPNAEMLKALVRSDAEYYKLALQEVVDEATYTRLYEKLMAAKRSAQMRAAF